MDNLKVFSLIFSASISILVPIGAVFYARKKHLISWKSVLWGIFTWIVFSQILERGVHLMVMKYTPIFTIPIALGIYGGLMAGLFEETGRFLVMKKWLKNKLEWKEGLAFGLGHGGIEAILIGGFGSFQVFTMLSIMQSGQLEKLELGKNIPPEIMQSLIELTQQPWYIFLLIGVERMFAMAIHIALSILVIYGIRERKIKYLFYAIGIHALVDFPAAFYQAKILNLWLVEIYLVMVLIAMVQFIIKSKSWFSNSVQTPLTGQSAKG